MVGLAGLLILAAANLLQTIYGQRKARTDRIRQKRVVDELRSDVLVVRDQVRNDHPEKPNMRDDIDEVKGALTDFRDTLKDFREALEGVHGKLDEQGRDVRGIRQDVGIVRGELRETRKDHRDLERRVVDFSRREHPGSEPL